MGQVVRTSRPDGVSSRRVELGLEVRRGLERWSLAGIGEPVSLDLERRDLEGAWFLRHEAARRSLSGQIHFDPNLGIYFASDPVVELRDQYRTTTFGRRWVRGEGAQPAKRSFTEIRFSDTSREDRFDFRDRIRRLELPFVSGSRSLGITHSVRAGSWALRFLYERGSGGGATEFLRDDRPILGRATLDHADSISRLEAARFVPRLGKLTMFAATLRERDALIGALNAGIINPILKLGTRTQRP